MRPHARTYTLARVQEEESEAQFKKKSAVYAEEERRRAQFTRLRINRQIPATTLKG